MDLIPLGYAMKLFRSRNHSKLKDACVGFYGYDGGEVSKAYIHSQIPESRISSLDVSRVVVQRDPSCIRYGDLLVFDGNVTPRGFRRSVIRLPSSPYEWVNESSSHSVQLIIKNTLLAVMSDRRVFADKSSMSNPLLKKLRKTTIPEMYRTSLQMLGRWKEQKENV